MFSKLFAEATLLFNVLNLNVLNYFLQNDAQNQKGKVDKFSI